MATCFLARWGEAKEEVNPTRQPKHAEDQRAKLEKKCTKQLLGYETSQGGEKFTYIKLNIPATCPPRAAFPRSTAGAPVASFIDDAPEQRYEPER